MKHDARYEKKKRGKGNVGKEEGRKSDKEQLRVCCVHQSS